ncbi:hypothetical protein D9619_013466 [Psilocybe cf. subviscida]|uniref:Uncharacterized protein n=1 Tax=Psilocybe cf. subviscida TaxID=2480587 RepID=A0A8H5F9K1_9AGAR|nr:hypothetical protein D9619_013466 [Psilocybe cf. subviscida]
MRQHRDDKVAVPGLFLFLTPMRRPISRLSMVSRASTRFRLDISHPNDVAPYTKLLNRSVIGRLAPMAHNSAQTSSRYLPSRLSTGTLFLRPPQFVVPGSLFSTDVMAPLRMDDGGSDSDSVDGLSPVKTSVLLGVPDGAVEGEPGRIDTAVSCIGGLPVVRESPTVMPRPCSGLSIYLPNQY